MNECDRGGTALEEAAVDELIKTAVDYLTERLYEPQLAPSAVANHIGLDPWRFCRRFKTVTGMTCSEFIAKKRMLEAKRLLARNELLIKEVAYRVGFEDANYFSRRFKVFVGISPSSFRRGRPAGEPHN
jgi:two-component system response regulator YesN